jgi:hypothetical protein
MGGTRVNIHRLRLAGVSDHAPTETRRLTVVLPLPEVERLRGLCRPGEGINELLRRVLQEVGR